MSAKPYTCNECGGKFAEPEEVGPGLGVASPCCSHHFTKDGEELPDGVYCSVDCCDHEPEPARQREDTHAGVGGTC